VLQGISLIIYLRLFLLKYPAAMELHGCRYRNPGGYQPFLSSQSLG
jgi:hypothetical protein